jgi:HAMP domain-containing protein
MDHRTFVLAAYALVFGVLLIYWRRVESGIRTLEAAAHPASERQ